MFKGWKVFCSKINCILTQLISSCNLVMPIIWNGMTGINEPWNSRGHNQNIHNKGIALNYCIFVIYHPIFLSHCLMNILLKKKASYCWRFKPLKTQNKKFELFCVFELSWTWSKCTEPQHCDLSVNIRNWSNLLPGSLT